MQTTGFKIFIWSYIVGIVMSCALAVALRLAGLSSWWLFGLGIGHMFVLIGLGMFGVQQGEKVVAGAKIQTAGYLHTLIGFTAAMMSITTNPQDIEHFSMLPLLVPLGSALLTSILGWFAGGEIGEPHSAATMHTLQSELEQGIQELQRFTGAITQTHHSYIETVRVMANEMKELHVISHQLYGDQEQSLQHAQQTAETVRQHLEPISGSVQQLSETLVAASNHVHNQLGPSFLSSCAEMQNTTHALQEILQAARQNFQNVSETAGNVTEYLNQKAIVNNFREVEKSSKEIAAEIKTIASALYVVKESLYSISKSLPPHSN